ncbi:hypothetical protein DYH55_16675 [Methylovirgula sp. 4M-Z18]|nr:hypothetical protein DYH55_16675 [Methylovirgula sp. 4M-Z18]
MPLSQSHLPLGEGLGALAICSIATEIGIEDACGHGDVAAARRSMEALRFVGDAIVTDVSGFVAAVGGRG